MVRKTQVLPNQQKNESNGTAQILTVFHVGENIFQTKTRHQNLAARPEPSAPWGRGVVRGGGSLRLDLTLG